MHAEGVRRRGRAGKLASAAIIAAAVVFGIVEWNRSSDRPSTDAATIDADVVHVAAAVGGRLDRLYVTENALVRAGQPLFRIDPLPYRLGVNQARADLELAKASKATQGRAVSMQQSAATVAGDQIARAMANLALAQRTVERLRPLAEQGYIPRIQLDQAETAEHDAATGLRQAREQRRGAAAAVDDTAGSTASIHAREAALAIAQRALSDTLVRATHAGRVVGLTVLSGEMVAPSQSLFTLVGDDEWFAVGNFRETELALIARGDCATVYAMADRHRAMRGVVDGIGSGVLDTDRVNLPHSVPYVERSLNWVRVAQRFPVRVRIEGPRASLMRLGASAVIQVRSGDACRR